MKFKNEHLENQGLVQKFKHGTSDAYAVGIFEEITVAALKGTPEDIHALITG